MSMSKRVWKLQDLVAHSGRIHCARLGEKSGQVLATGGDDKRVNIWKVGKPHAMMSLTGPTSAVESLVFDKQEEVLIVGCGGGSMQVWNLEYRKLSGTLTGHRTACAAVEFHPYCEFFASGSADTNLKIWDLRKKQCIQTYKGHTGAITSIRFSPHGRWVATGGQDNMVKLWDLTAGKIMRDLDLHKAAITSVAFHPKEYLLASGSADRTMKLWSLESFRCVGTTELGSSPVQAVKFYVEEQSLLSASSESLRVFSADNLSTPLDTIDVEWKGLQDMRLHFPEEKLIAISTEGSQLGIWVADLQKRDIACAKPGNYGRAYQRGPSTSYPKVMSQAPRRADKVDLPDSEDIDNANLQGSDPDEMKTVKPQALMRGRQSPKAGGAGINAISPTHNVMEQGREAQYLDRRWSRDAVDTPMGVQDQGAASPKAPPSHVTPNPPQRPIRAKSPDRAASPTSSEERVVQIPSTPSLTSGLPIQTPSSKCEAPGIAIGTPSVLPPRPQRPVNDTSIEQVLQLAAQHPQMMGVLQRRLSQIRRLKQLWASGNFSGLTGVLQMPQDHAVFCDFIRAILRQHSEGALNLDACQTILPILRDLLGSKYDDFVYVALQFVEVLLQNFGDVIIDTRQSCSRIPERQLDLAREERLTKCNACYDQFREISRLLPDSQLKSRFGGLRSNLHVFLQRC